MFGGLKYEIEKGSLGEGGGSYEGDDKKGEGISWRVGSVERTDQEFAIAALRKK